MEVREKISLGLKFFAGLMLLNVVYHFFAAFDSNSDGAWESLMIFGSLFLGAIALFVRSFFTNNKKKREGIKSGS